MSISSTMQQIGIQLPPAPPKGGVYQSVKPFGQNLCYVSGCGPADASLKGKLGKDLTIEQGQQAARSAALNFLSAIEAQIGSLDRIKSIVKVLVLVQSADDFYDQPQVANGATQLFVDLFGAEIGAPSRSAIGCNALPGNIPVEIEGLIELRD